MAAGKKKGLGRGLDALFADVSITSEQTAAPEPEKEQRRSMEAGNVIFLDIHKIKPNEKQPRKQFDPEKIEELAQSIEMHGVLQPIMVIPVEEGYQIVAGERRWRAAQKAHLKRVPCLVRELTEEQNMLIALIENMQREDLNAIEEADAIQQMMEKHHLTQEEIAKSVGKSRPYISNAIRLLRLPESVRKLVSEGKLSGGHARALAALHDEKMQEEAAKRAVEEGWSVRKMEDYAGECSGKGKEARSGKQIEKPGKKKTAAVIDLEDELKTILGTKVKLAISGKHGKIEIEFYNGEELERIIELLRTVKE